MGEIHSQKEPLTANSPQPTPTQTPPKHNPAERGYGLPPLPPGLRRSVSDLSAASPSLNSEETAATDSVKLRMMKERFEKMRQLLDDKEKNVREEEECIAAEDEKVLPQDDLRVGDSEEGVSGEWAEKCLSIRFKCPCGKGYEVLHSQNNFYYKLKNHKE